MDEIDGMNSGDKGYKYINKTYSPKKLINKKRR